MARLRNLVLACLALVAIAADSYQAIPLASPHLAAEAKAEAPSLVTVASAGQVSPELSEFAPELQTTAGKDPIVEKVIRGAKTGLRPAVEAEPAIILSGHVVEAGDTLIDIAARYDTSVATIQELNGLADPHSLLVGQELLIADGFSDSGILTRVLGQSGFDLEVIGESSQGNPIESYRAGQGQYHVIVVGAIHGGYEWNTALLAYRIITHFAQYPERIPAQVTLHVIPTANPDGVAIITGEPGPFDVRAISGDTTAGRLNGNRVDLNRNWGCDWSPHGQWRQVSVSGGARPLSEPETRALRQYFVSVEPEVVIWLHSAAGLLVPGNCDDIRHAASERAAQLYGSLSGYPVGEFSAYPVTGDAADWLAQHKIASFTVELSNHQDLEFDRNLAGLLSLLENIDTLGEE